MKWRSNTGNETETADIIGTKGCEDSGLRLEGLWVGNEGLD